MARISSKLPSATGGFGVGGVISELRKVTWPTFFEAFRLTILVLVVSIMLGLFFGLVVDNLSTRFISFIAG